jgi:hypothetical protein
MTPSGGPATSVLISHVAEALREAGDEGLTLSELEVAVRTRFVPRLIGLMQAGEFTIGKDGDRYVLVAERDVGRRIDTAPSLPEIAVGKVSASSSIEPERLFESSSAHFDWDMAA